MDPREIVPPEMWVQIFDKVKNPSDWLNFLRTSPCFQGPLGGQKCLVLLPQILPFVLPYFHKEKVNEMLRLRLVSKEFKRAVDSMLVFESENEISQRLKRKYIFYESPETPERWRIRTFLDRFGSHVGNPIISRYLDFDFYSVVIEAEARLMENPPGMPEPDEIPPIEVEQFSNLITRLLLKFGTHLREFGIQGHGLGLGSCRHFVHTLESFLRLTPQLEILHFGFDTGADPEEVVLLPQIEDHHGSSVILSNLKSLRFYGNQQVPDSAYIQQLQNVILRMVCNPASLKEALMWGVPPELASNFPKLETLRIEYLREEDQVTLGSAQWPLLSKLVVDSNGMDIRKVINCAENFRKTLTSLIILRPHNPKETLLELRIDLPNLKHLKIMHTASASLFNISGNLSSLEKIIVEHLPRNLLYEREFVKYVESVRKQGIRSGLWKLLPKLKKIVVYTTRFRKVLLRENCAAVERWINCQDVGERIFIFLVTLFKSIFLFLVKTAAITFAILIFTFYTCIVYHLLCIRIV